MLAFAPQSWDPAAWSAVAAWATVAVYVVLAIFALRQVSEARRLREEQARPFVVAEFVPGLILMFRVQNHGKTAARNVTIDWETFPTTTRDEPLWKDKNASVLFRSGIPFLPPGQTIETLFDHFPDRVAKALPMTFKVTVQYQSFDEKQTYTESYHLDLELYRGLRRVERKDIHHVAVALEKLRDTTAKWTDGPRGLKVIATDRNRSRRNEDRPFQISEARRAYRSTGWRGLVRHLWRNFLTRHGLYTVD